MSLKDRLRDWAEQKGAWTRILLGAGIAILIMIILMASCVPSKGLVNNNAADIAGIQDTVEVNTDSLGTKASQASLEKYKKDFNEALGDHAADISDHGERLGIAEVKLAQARTDITTMQGQINATINSPLKATLTGTFGNYTMTVKSDEAGNYTAKLHLVYSSGVGSAANYTAALEGFYASVNWSVNATVPQYVAVPTYDGATWGIAGVWWNVETFELVADTEKSIGITCAGLDSTWQPDYAYVEVYRAW